MKELVKNNKKNPLYKQICERLKSDIENGVYRIDERIMSEPEISVFYNVSRITARNALEELEKEGYIYRIRGKGSYVCWEQPNEMVISNRDSTISRWVSFFHETHTLSDLNLIPVASVLQKYCDVPDTMLGLTFTMDRYTGNTVTYYSYFPLLSQLDLEKYAASQSIRTIYRENGSHPMRFVQRIHALISDEIIAEKYNVPVNTVVLFEMLAFYNGKNELMELTVGCYGDSESILTVKLQ